MSSTALSIPVTRRDIASAREEIDAATDKMSIEPAGLYLKTLTPVASLLIDANNSSSSLVDIVVVVWLVLVSNKRSGTNASRALYANDGRFLCALAQIPIEPRQKQWMLRWIIT